MLRCGIENSSKNQNSGPFAWGFTWDPTIQFPKKNGLKNDYRWIFVASSSLIWSREFECRGAIPSALLCAAAMLEEFTLVQSCRFGYVFVQVFSAWSSRYMWSCSTDPWIPSNQIMDWKIMSLFFQLWCIVILGVHGEFFGEFTWSISPTWHVFLFRQKKAASGLRTFHDYSEIVCTHGDDLICWVHNL